MLSSDSPATDLGLWAQQPHPQLVPLDHIIWPCNAAEPHYGRPHRLLASGGEWDRVQCLGAELRPFPELLAVVREGLHAVEHSVEHSVERRAPAAV
jgi:hypothetical protein